MLFKRGDTTAIMITLDEALQPGYKLKVALFDSRNQELWSLVIDTDNNTINYDYDPASLSYYITLGNNVTKELIGDITLRLVIFNPDGSYVNSGEQLMKLHFVDEPINWNLF